MSTSLTQAQDVKDFLWATYDTNDDLIYPTISNWDELLAETIESNGYDKLDKGQVLSILFGMINRNRIVDGLWYSFLDSGVTQKLLTRLQALDTGMLGLNSA